MKKLILFFSICTVCLQIYGQTAKKEIIPIPDIISGLNNFEKFSVVLMEHGFYLASTDSTGTQWKSQEINYTVGHSTGSHPALMQVDLSYSGTENGFRRSSIVFSIGYNDILQEYVSQFINSIGAFFPVKRFESFEKHNPVSNHNVILSQVVYSKTDSPVRVLYFVNPENNISTISFSQEIH